jgi:hypothetical protein
VRLDSLDDHAKLVHETSITHPAGGRFSITDPDGKMNSLTYDSPCKAKILIPASQRTTVETLRYEEDLRLGVKTVADKEVAKAITGKRLASDGI